MRKLLTTILFLLAVFAGAKAQQEVLFKIKMMPNHDYSSIMKMNMDMTMNYDGSDTAVVNKIKASGMKMPMLMQMETGMQSEMKTGAVGTTTQEFPFSMNIKQAEAKMTMNGKDFPMPPSALSNQKIFGKSTGDGKITIDSVAGKALNDVLRESVMSMVKNIQTNVKFPEKPMKVGDTFTQDVPIDIPIPGLNSKMNMNATYKLLSIENGKANFSINFIIGMNMDNAKAAIDMKGDGDGKFVYDMATNYSSNMQENMNLVFSVSVPMPQQNMKMKGNMKMIMDQQTTVAAN